VAVRGLWEQASEEERHRAHQTCMVMLEYWLGKITKQQAAERLSVPALRVWQLSQQALSGMLAGLLKQPRRGRPSTDRSTPMDPGDDPKVLKKKIAELEHKLKIAEDLIRLFRDLPLAEPPKSESPRSGKTSSPKPAGKKRRRKTPPPGRPKGSGDSAAGSEPDPKG
jgi:hypothetical protein